MFSKIFNNLVSKVFLGIIVFSLVFSVSSFAKDISPSYSPVVPAKIVKTQPVYVPFAENVSKSNSVMTPSDQIAQTGTTPTIVTVILMDDKGTPVKGHTVEVISSSSADKVEAISSKVSDVKGRVSFRMTSSAPGPVTYIAYDLTSNVILDHKTKILYFDTPGYVFNGKASVLDYNNYSSYGSPSGAVDHLKFKDVPVVINPGEAVDFKISAYDKSEQVVTNYNGKIHFTVTSGDPTAVILPNDYLFEAKDLGEHVFSLATLFKIPGTYTLKAEDDSSPDVSAEQTFTVAAPNTPQNGAVVITSPVAGMYGNNIQSIEGTAPKGAKLKIFSNEVEIASVTADIDGKFAFTTTPLPEGAYKIYVAQVNDVGTILASSATVEITIKNSKPEISNIEILPAVEVETNTEVTVKIYPKSADVVKASIVLLDNIYDCTLVVDHFEAKFLAPQEFGDYPFSVILADKLNNESKIDNAAVLKVKGQLASPATTTIGDVSGLIARPEDKRVVLNWHAPTIAVNLIKNYRVYYGKSQTQLTDVVDTFTNATTWYIPNLENGTEYFFAVVAVDEKGNVSEHYSNIVNAVPNPIVVEPVVIDVVPPLVDMGAVGGDDIEALDKDVSKTGPDASILMLLSSLGGIGFNEFRRYQYLRKLKKNSGK